MGFFVVVIIAAYIAFFHRLGPFVASIFIADVVLWPFFLVVTQDPETATAEKTSLGHVSRKNDGRIEQEMLLEILP